VLSYPQIFSMNALNWCHLIANTPCATPEQPEGLTSSNIFGGYT
jgi:hypothetical protein